jgi:hypothetical protein
VTIYCWNYCGEKASVAIYCGKERLWPFTAGIAEESHEISEIANLLVDV